MFRIAANHLAMFCDLTRMWLPRAITIIVFGLAGNGSALSAPEVAKASKIVMGAQHTCALTTTGGVKCWGANGAGQVGGNLSPTANRVVVAPVDVIGLASGVTEIAAGSNHTCAIIASGGVRCWGLNRYGQVGDNSMIDRATPTDVVGLTENVVAIAAGSDHTCASTTSGQVKCWGYNQAYQLGDNSRTNRWTPVDVTGLTGGVATIAAGRYHTCALTVTGGVKCWGSNNSGELGDNSNVDSPIPVDVDGLASGVAAIAAGDSTSCAVILGSGRVKCWGTNWAGQLGDNSLTTRSIPVDVIGLADSAAAVFLGPSTCVLTTNGRVSCWGGSSFAAVPPNPVPGVTYRATALALGASSSCVINTSGGVQCWGSNVYGQFGNLSTQSSAAPTNASGFVGGLIDNGDGTVTDTLTGLTWMRCSFTPPVPTAWAGSCGSFPALGTWDAANALTGTIDYAGQTDWRLPTIRELLTINDPTAEVAFNRGAFPDTSSRRYWSSTLAVNGNPGSGPAAWLVNMGGNETTFVDTSTSVFRPEVANVRLVRSGPVSSTLLGLGRPTTDYVDHGDGTVTHLSSKLMWQKCAIGQAWNSGTCNGNAASYKWSDAQVVSDGLAGYTDWRVPTRKELETIVDYTVDGPALNQTVFPTTPAYGFWAIGHSSSYGVGVHFLNGASFYVPPSVNDLHIRLVRDAQYDDDLAGSPKPVDLAVNTTGIGSGRITSSPAGIDCMTSCKGSFASNTLVTLTAYSASVSTFTGWSGACTNTTATCTVTMDGAQSVTANFAKPDPFCQAGAGAATNPNSAYVVDSANGTVTDTRSGLMWDQCPSGLSGSGCATGPRLGYSYNTAKSVAAGLTTYKVQSGWRLPSITELKGLVETCRTNPAINTDAFPNTISTTAGAVTAFWSADLVTNNPAYAKFVAFGDGFENYQPISKLFQLRLVRSTSVVAPTSVTVTASGGANGSITPLGPQTVAANATTTFTVVANAGYTASVGGACGGTLTGTTYTTNSLTANCTVVASFGTDIDPVCNSDGVQVTTISRVNLDATMIAARAQVVGYGGLKQTYNVTCSNGRFGVVRTPGSLSPGGETYALVQRPASCVRQDVKIPGPAVTTKLDIDAAIAAAGDGKTDATDALKKTIVGPLATAICQ